MEATKKEPQVAGVSDPEYTDSSNSKRLAENPGKLSSEKLREVLPTIPSVVKGLKRESSKSLAGPCPKCGGDDRFYYREDLERFACRHCHPEKGDTIEFTCWLEGTDFKGLCEKYLPENTGDKHAEAVSYLMSRKVSHSTIQQMIEAGKIWQQPYMGKPAIAALYGSLNGNDQGKRTVQYIPLSDGDKKFKKGSKAGEDFFTAGNPQAETLILTEAVINALSVADMLPEYRVIALGGSTLTEKTEQLKDCKVICFFDNDQAGQKATDAVAKILPNCRTVQWLKDDPESYDPNDLLKTGQGHRIKEMVEVAEPVKQDAKSEIKVLNLLELLNASIPERTYLLRPVVPSQGLVLLYAPRGIGKTYFALSCALTMAAGNQVFFWQASTESRVLYIDGEMPGTLMQERAEALVAGMDAQINPEKFKIITPDLSGSLPNLASKEGQTVISRMADNYDVLIMDNLSTVMDTGKESGGDEWMAVQGWLLELRRAGKSVVMVHHAGKSGNQRGTSRREDILDTVISLKRPQDYKAAEGARVNVHLEKARGIYGPEAEPFEAVLTAEENGALTWATRPLEEAELQMVRELWSAGLKIREIAEETGLSKSKVHRLTKKL